ncbi:MAG: ABC transporter permease [Gemmatimonadota bacterium]|uniref:ABC transporter permease n=1 Tax=Candidatus Palauibacter scopulicola TaxID=3056741 RepID=UPI00238980EF|nr:ABC transporter permease [Candidatus Palauibacter scopulicola]MDE2663422.1 ABC transporter permease [Candidatus Palauibacter scopulicola]
MRLLDAARQLWADLSAQRVRTTLTVLGITWGTVAVVVLLAFSVGLERQTIKRFHGLGDRIVILFGGRTTMPHAGFREGRSIRLREADAEILARRIPDITMISPEYSTRAAPVRYGRNGVNPNITGIYPIYGEMRNIIPLPGGRFINERDQRERRRVVFLGDEVARVLFGDADPVGDQVRIGDSPFTVIGVLQPKVQNSSYNSRDEDRVFIPAGTHAALFGSRFVSNLVYRTADASRTEDVEARVYEVLGAKYRFNPADDDALAVWDTAEWERMFGFLFLGFKIFFAIVGSFTLSVGGIGVANIMYIVVRERTNEIGIKRSLGATRRSILWQFLTESMLIVVAGAALGVVVSLGVVKLMSLVPMQEFVGTPTISLQVAAVTLALLAFIAMLAGFFPARRAAALDPVECLRD